MLTRSNISQFFLLSVCLLAACRPSSGENKPGAVRDSHPLETGQGDTSNSGLDSADDTAVSLLDGVQLVGIEREGHEDYGYELATYAVVEDGYLATDGQLPLFQVFRPIETPSGGLPLLVWFHGGHIGNDDSGVLPENCQRDAIDANIGMVTGEASLVTEMAARRGWAMLIPRNDWCDAGFGLGDDDPVEPGRHFGQYHVERALAWVDAGHAGFQPGGARFGWGTSAGGAWSFYTAQRLGGFSGLVVDSGSCDQVLLHGQDPGSVEHILGGAPYDTNGDPSEFFSRYQETSCTHLVDEKGLRVPTYVAWNDQDMVIPANQPARLVISLENASNNEGLRYGAHDFDHGAPSPNNHVQTRLRNLPWGYTTDAMFSFLEGRRIVWREAEEGCLAEPCDVGQVGGVESRWQSFSHGAGLKVGAGEGAGVIFRAGLPPGFAPQSPITVVAVVDVDGLDGLAGRTETLTLSYTEGERREETHISAEVFAPDTNATDADLLQQYESTRFTFTPQAPGGGTVSVRARGVGEIYLDALIFVGDH